MADMELISKYLTVSHQAVFNAVYKLWKDYGVAGTPEMADLIENTGIDRHTFKLNFANYSEPLNGYEIYTVLLAVIIDTIDSQQFDTIPNIFEIYEEDMKDTSL